MASTKLCEATGQSVAAQHPGKTIESECRLCGAKFSYSKPEGRSPGRTRKKCATCLEAKQHRLKQLDLPRNCRGCGSIFSPPTRQQSVFCTEKCRESFFRRTRQSRRRSLIKTGERVDWLKVMRRDKWTCHICHRKTPRKLRGTTSPLAPELDHIIPVSLGGQHTYDNTACSCKECNHHKKDRVLGQLSLFSAPVTAEQGRGREAANIAKLAMRDGKIIAAIEALTLLGRRPTYREISEVSGIKIPTIRMARQRTSHPWAKMVAIHTPTESRMVQAARRARQDAISRKLLQDYLHGLSARKQHEIW